MSPSRKTVSGIVLAAGASRRMAGDRPKQLLELGRRPLVRRVAEAALASRLDEVIVVLGHAAREVAAALEGLTVATVVNPDHRRGQSTSVRAGLAAIASDAAAALFMPADQPLLSSRLIDRLIDAYSEGGAAIVVPTWEGCHGAPTLFDRSLFSELENLAGDTGGRSVRPRYASRIREVPVDDARELADVDTEDDLRRLMRRLQSSSQATTSRRRAK